MVTWAAAAAEVQDEPATPGPGSRSAVASSPADLQPGSVVGYRGTRRADWGEYVVRQLTHDGTRAQIMARAAQNYILHRARLSHLRPAGTAVELCGTCRHEAGVRFAGLAGECGVPGCLCSEHGPQG